MQRQEEGLCVSIGYQRYHLQDLEWSYFEDLGLRQDTLQAVFSIGGTKMQPYYEGTNVTNVHSQGNSVTPVQHPDFHRLRFP